MFVIKWKQRISVFLVVQSVNRLLLFISNCAETPVQYNSVFAVKIEESHYKKKQIKLYLNVLRINDK